MSTMAEERRYREGDEPVPGFRLVAFLGAGAFGEVWKAVSAGGVDVAMKILYRIDRKAGRKAFRALQLVKNIKHPHLVPIQAFWLKDEHGSVLDDDIGPEFATEASSIDLAIESSDLRETLDPANEAIEIRETPNMSSRPAELIIAMGLADETIHDRMQRHQAEGKVGIPFAELIGYLEGAAKGLDFLNGPHNIQHGDIKPQNMMINGGEGMVSDFDLAKNLGDARATSTKAFTVAYVPPEVFHTGNPTSTSDQYAFAISYCELRTGRLPYVAETATAAIAAKTSGRLDLSDLPKAERKIIKKATSRDPGKRYRNCRDLVRALRGDLTDWPKVLRRIAAALVVLSVGIGIWMLPTWKPYDLTSLARRVFAPKFQENETYLGLPKGEAIEQADHERLILALEGIRSLLGKYPADECGDLVPLQTAYLKRLMGLASDAVAENARRARLIYEEVRTHLEKLGDEHADAEITLAAENGRFQPHATLGLARCKTRLDAPPDEILTLLKDVDASRDELDSQELSCMLAVKSLVTNRITQDLLASDLLQPLATLIRENGDGLNPWEAHEIEALVGRISTEYFARYGSVSPPPQTAQLASVITGGDSELNRLWNQAKFEYSRAFEANAPIERRWLDDMKRYAAKGENGGGKRSEIQQRIDALEVLVNLGDPSVSNRDLQPLRTALGNLAGFTVTDFCSALLRRAEREALGGWTNLPSDALVKLQDIDKILALDMAPGTIDPRGLQTFRTRLTGIRAVTAISDQQIGYDQLRSLSDTFLESEPASDTDDILVHLVRLSRAECQAVEYLGSQSESSLPHEADRVRNAIQPIRNGPAKFRDYGLVGEAILSLCDSAHPTVVPTAEKLMADLSDEAIRETVEARPERSMLVAEVLLRAAETKRRRPASGVSEQLVELVSPFQAGEEEAAYRLLTFIRDRLGKTELIQTNTMLAEAAFFLGPPLGPDYGLAKALSQQLLADHPPTPLLLLIHAHSSQLRERTPDGLDADLAAALESYGKFTDLWQQRPDNQVLMPDSEYYRLVIQKALEFSVQSTALAQAIHKLEENRETWGGLDPATQQICQDTARIYAAKARELRNKPELDESILDVPQHIVELCEKCVLLDPKNVDYLIDKALAHVAVSATVKEQRDGLREIADQIRSIDARHPGIHVLEGRYQLLEARLTMDKVVKRPLLEKAIQCFDNVESSQGEYPTEYLIREAYCLRNKADAQVRLANTYAEGDEGIIEGLLTDARNAANRALSLRDGRKSEFVYLVLGNALEDQGLLLKRFEMYREAVKMFQTAKDLADSNFRPQQVASACLCLGRCKYRLSLATKEDHLTEALSVLEEGCRQDKVELREKAEIHMYQGRVHRLLGTRSESTTAVFDHLVAASDAFDIGVKDARDAKIPEWALWQVESAYNAVDLWRQAVDENTQRAWSAKALQRVDEILATLEETGKKLDHSDAGIALACIKIKTLLLQDTKTIRQIADRVIELIPQPDLQIHLHLLRAQYAAEEEMSINDWKNVKPLVRRDITDATAIADAHPEVNSIWKARILGQSALSYLKDFRLATQDDQKKMSGLATTEELNRAIALFDQTGNSQAASDAVCLRYVTGIVTYNLLKLKNSDGKSSFNSDQWNDLKTTATNELTQLETNQVWQQRQNQLNSANVSKVDWDWGVDEWEALFDANFEAKDIDLVKRLRGIIKQMTWE